MSIGRFSELPIVSWSALVRTWCHRKSRFWSMAVMVMAAATVVGPARAVIAPAGTARAAIARAEIAQVAIPRVMVPPTRLLLQQLLHQRPIMRRLRPLLLPRQQQRLLPPR